MEKKLIKNKKISKFNIEKEKKIIDAEIESAFRFAKNSPFPNKNILMQHIYEK